jgi:peptidoglycan/LPS O-acetylase OafA/YrhL
VDLRIPGLDLLRIVTGIALIVCHGGYWLAPFHLPDTLWMLLGHMGVELFLVSSGFLLAEHALKATSPPSLAQAWLRTLVRLWPLYAVFLLCNLALLPADAARPPVIAYLTLTQNLAWPHPRFFGEAWIVAAAAMIALTVTITCRLLRQLAFRSGLLVIVGMLVAGHAVRGLLVVLGDPSFDEGVRKILITRLDLPFYGVLVAWFWVHRYEAIMRWRGLLALLSLGMLLATAAIHLLVPLDTSLAARILLFPLADFAWVALLPWLCSMDASMAIARPARVLAASAYSGLLTHMTLLRLADARGLSMTASEPATGVLLLLSYLLLSIGVALLVSLALDRNVLDFLGRRFAPPAEHGVPVAER